MNSQIVLYLPTLQPGGVQRFSRDLCTELLKRDFNISIVVSRTTFDERQHFGSDVQIVDLGVSRVRNAIFPLARYLKAHQPSTLISFTDPGNVVAIIARAIAQARTRLVISCHQTIKDIHPDDRKPFHTFMPLLMRLTYPRADSIIAVSNAIADEVSKSSGIARDRIKVIYNMVRADEVRRLSAQPISDPWFNTPDTKIILGVGRLTAQKNFALLVRAFGIVRQRVKARLVILGEGNQRSQLEGLVRSLGLEQSVSLPGYKDNPYSYMRNSSVFVSTSHAEAFGIAIVEALLCRTPVIATDCPGGIREVLSYSNLGTLVPQNDEILLAEAIIANLADQKLPESAASRIIELSDPDRCTNAYISEIAPKIP